MADDVIRQSGLLSVKCGHWHLCMPQTLAACTHSRLQRPSVGDYRHSLAPGGKPATEDVGVELSDPDLD